MQKWTDEHSIGVGVNVGFLIESSHDFKSGSRWHLSDRAARANMSGEERSSGWCGTTDNVALYAHGVGRIVRTANNGRVLLKQLTGEEARAAYLDLGHPDLADEDPNC